MSDAIAIADQGLNQAKLLLAYLKANDIELSEVRLVWATIREWEGWLFACRNELEPDDVQ